MEGVRRGKEPPTMKQGTIITRVAMTILFLALAAYIGIYALRSLSDPFTSGVCYRHTVDDGVEATGYVVRAEEALPVQNGIVDILPEEGEKVAAGETVALVYQDAAALDRKSEMRQLELELEQLEYSLRRDTDNGDAAKLDQDIFSAMVALRGSTAGGDYSRLEDRAMELKNLVFRRSYTYTNNTQSVEGISAMVRTVSDRLSTLRGQALRDTVGLRVDRPGTYSGQVDGYEQVLTPETVMGLTPSQLDKLSGHPVPQGEGMTGKLITNSRWYFVCPLTERQAERLVEGKQVTLRFSRDFTGDVSMRVERIGEPENGRVAVVFSSTRFLSDVTLLRRQTVEIVFDSVTGLRVPKAALRVEEKTVTHPDTKAESVVQEAGVYAVVGAQAEWKPVSILAEEEDFFLVSPATFQNEQNMNETKRALRSGDEIILTADALFDGKVVK